LKRRNLYTQDWHFEVEAEAAHVAEVVLAWCRETLASCRRPFGIDYFDVAIAARDPLQGQRSSLSLSKQRPQLLYGPTFVDDLARLLMPAGETAAPARLYVSAAIFSWGDAAHEALPS
jgi:hypothetical protein